MKSRLRKNGIKFIYNRNIKLDVDNQITNSTFKEIFQVRELISQAKFNEALQLINAFEEKGDPNDQNQLLCYTLKSKIFFHQGKYEKVLLLAEKTYQKSISFGDDLLSLDALNLKAKALWLLDKLNNASDVIVECESLLNTINKEPEKEIALRRASLDIVKGMVLSTKGDSDLGLEILEQCLKLREKYGDKQEIMEALCQIALVLALYKGELDQALIYTERCEEIAEEIEDKLFSPSLFLTLGIIYGMKRENDLSLMYYEKCLAIYKEADHKPGTTIILNNIGECYRKMGKLDQSLKYLEESLVLCEEMGFINKYSMILDSLISTTLIKGDVEQAQFYLEKMEQLNESQKDKMIDVAYRVNKAMVLKESSLFRDQAKAEELLRQVVEEDVIVWALTIKAILHLCDLLLAELSVTNNKEILKEIEPLIIRLLDIAKNQRLYWIRGEAYLFKAKLALINYNMKEARQLLTKAQKLSEKYGLKSLAIKISSEHDELLKQSTKWGNLKESKAPVVKRMEVACLNEPLDSMIREQNDKIPELEAEQPVLLSILTIKGVMLLSSPFCADMTIDDTLFGTFLTSFNSFSKQIFSEKIDRVQFAQYTILIEGVDSFLICYIFQGQTYGARQKLNHFTEVVKKDLAIIGILQNANDLKNLIIANENLFLEEVIFECFLSDPQQFQMPFKAYMGDDPFVFVSYAHTDRLQVYPIIDYLNKMKINIWYDEGIPFGKDWKKSIVKNLERSKAFLVFITPHIIDSEYVKKEIRFAIREKKKFFAVYLRETKLPSDIIFDIADIQYLNKKTLPENKFQNKLTETLYSELYE